MKIHFYLRFHTKFGQTLWICDNGGQLGTDMIENAIPMKYLNEAYWEASVKADDLQRTEYRYRYILKNKEGEIVPEWGDDRIIELHAGDEKESIVTIDTWNHAGDFENAFYTAPFRDVLLKQKKSKDKPKAPSSYTHLFKVKAPLLGKHEAVCLLGTGHQLGNWSKKEPVILNRIGNWWVAYLDLSQQNFPIAYKYGIYDKEEKEFIRFEDGDNRILHTEAGKKKTVMIHDGFARFPNNTWKGAGVSIPVFSLRSKKSFGIGEFTDLKLLVDWARSAGLKMIQILPVNDTTATHTWRDSYPYAAISAFALHPAYISLAAAAGKKNADIIKSLSKKQKQLNQLAEVDFEAVMNCKLAALRDIYKAAGKDDLKSDEFKKFFQKNRHWLAPYAAFCYLRDQHQTSHFEEWPAHSVYDAAEIEKLVAGDTGSNTEIGFHYFVQFHLHLQLKEAADYAHKKGIILKGDIPIGIYRYGCDAWMAPGLYNLCLQAGAPPDDFAVKGQNWGFPIYNWKKMQEDHFDWWRKRFEQMSHYFDAFRIDHILGFFRIWGIPMHAVEGIMGHFVPAIPVRITEFGERGIWFDYHRYCKPYITDAVLQEIFGELADKVKREFLRDDGLGSYEIISSFETQRQVEKYFDSIEQSEENTRLKNGLYDLISNVILFEENDSEGSRFHFRISMEHTTSFRYLDHNIQHQLHELYIHYFYKRQDDFWKQEAMHKLPYLKRATNMLICGEDLGMVPHCVPEVMQQLGILSLEIQRMPKETGKEFFHPAEAPYLSVVTPSTHDMSTIRGWWEEDRDRATRFFHHELGQHGDPPLYCEPWICRAIILQHLYSPAMWSVFQLQDLLSMSEDIRRENPHEERINIPANPNHYWKYRMHKDLEDLIAQKKFNTELKQYVHHSGR